jgi:biofilm PGA synthesis N-glycosyltransferase PgaC
LALVVTFLNEADVLPRFLESLTAQTRAADIVFLVDDGSTDRSAEIAELYAEGRDAVRLLRRPARSPERDRLAGAGEFKAFLWAVDQLELPWTVVGKMDADLELAPRTLETLENAFINDAELGLAGAALSELDARGQPVRLVSPREHVEGATKFYRRACWQDISPVPPILGWDTLDEFVARMRGWRTETFVVPGGDPIHLRRMGTHGAILRSFRRWGVCSYGYGAHPLQVLFYGLRLSVTRRPRVIGGLNYLAGWAASFARRAPRADPELRREVRREQLARMRRRLGTGIFRHLERR